MLHEFSKILHYNDQCKIHKSLNNWACYNYNYESKFTNIQILTEYMSKTNVQCSYEKLSQFPDYNQIYTDGSNKQDGVSMAIYVCKNKTEHGSKLPQDFSFNSAECLAILAALQYIKEHKSAADNKWLIISDSLSVLKALKSNEIHTKVNYEGQTESS